MLLLYRGVSDRANPNTSFAISVSRSKIFCVVLTGIIRTPSSRGRYSRSRLDQSSNNRSDGTRRDIFRRVCNSVVFTLKLHQSVIIFFVLSTTDGSCIVTQHNTVKFCFTRQNDIYIYPDLWICTHVSYGCDIYEDVEACARSTNETEGGPTSATYRPEDEDETTINFDVDFTEKVRIHVSTYYSKTRDCCVVRDDLKYW